jgi:hypothetical protein
LPRWRYCDLLGFFWFLCFAHSLNRNHLSLFITLVGSRLGSFGAPVSELLNFGSAQPKGIADGHFGNHQRSTCQGSQGDQEHRDPPKQLRQKDLNGGANVTAAVTALCDIKAAPQGISPHPTLIDQYLGIGRAGDGFFPHAIRVREISLMSGVYVNLTNRAHCSHNSMQQSQRGKEHQYTATNPQPIGGRKPITKVPPEKPHPDGANGNSNHRAAPTKQLENHTQPDA